MASTKTMSMSMSAAGRLDGRIVGEISNAYARCHGWAAEAERSAAEDVDPEPDRRSIMAHVNVSTCFSRTCKVAWKTGSSNKPAVITLVSA